MTISEIKVFIDAVIAAVTEEVNLAADVSTFGYLPSETYSNLLLVRMTEELVPVVDDVSVFDFRISRSFNLCTAKGLLVIEFTYDEDPLDLEVEQHKIRVEVVDNFHPTSKEACV